MGLRDVCWSETDGEQLTVVGYGWHPGEHITYITLWVEPYPAFAPRSLRITTEKNRAKAAQSCKVELVLDPSLPPCGAYPWDYYFSDERWCNGLLYVGTTSCRAKNFLGKVFIDLKDVKLERLRKPSESIMVSGRVAAKKGSLKNEARVLKDFDPNLQHDPDQLLEHGLVEMFRTWAQTIDPNFPAVSSAELVKHLEVRIENIQARLYEAREPLNQHGSELRDKLRDVYDLRDKPKNDKERTKLMDEIQNQHAEAERLVQQFKQERQVTLEPLEQGIRFVEGLGGKGDWRYVGRGVSFGDGEAAILCYRPPDSDSYRIIYGDLTVEEVAPDELPKQ
jgi:hypothetical protein